jgi:hypothetical protein
MRDQQDHNYELTDAQKQGLRRRRAKKVRSFIAKANPTPIGAEQYEVPAGCNRVRFVQTGTADRVRVEFLPSPDTDAPA